MPLGLGALAMTVGAALLLSNLLLVAVGGHGMKLARGLDGVTRPEKARFTLDGVLHGSYQAIYARLIGTRLPLYPLAVRLRNQMEYSLFGVAAVPSLMVGRGSSLIETVYAQEYCSRDIAAWQPGAVRWAAQIREMQDATERLGKTFLYVLTPSKVAQYPDILPLGYTCPSSTHDRAELVPKWMKIVRAAGIHVADTTAALTQAHDAYPFPLYPLGGIHWNQIGAAIGVQAVMAQLDALRPGQGLAPFAFRWRMTTHPSDTDLDLARLMNLFVLPGNVLFPAVTVQPSATPQPCPKLRAVIIGGSFGHSIGEFLSTTPCHVSIVEYEYWHLFTLTWVPKTMVIDPTVDAARREADVLNADILIYEENEQILGHSEHGPALWQLLHDKAAGPG